MFFRVPSARFKYVKYITEPWQFEIDPLHLGGMGTRYSTLGVGQSYIMLRVFENADNNPFAAILRELDHTLASRRLVCSQLAGE